jgi:hypothetical protein
LSVPGRTVGDSGRHLGGACDEDEKKGGGTEVRRLFFSKKAVTW